MTILLAHALAKDKHKGADYICVETAPLCVMVYVYEFHNEGGLYRTDYTNGVKLDAPEYVSLKDMQMDFATDKANPHLVAVSSAASAWLVNRGC